MVSVRTDVRKVLLLDFELPGVRWTGHGGAGGGPNDSQLKQGFEENWQMQVTTENALATAETLRKLAAAIVEAFKT